MKELFDKLYNKSEESFYKILDKNLKENKKTFIVTANPETFMMSEKDTEMRDLLLDKDTILVPDGIGIVKAARMINYDIKERIAGIDIANKLLELGNKQKKSIYLFGAKQEVIDSMKEVLKNNYPNLKLSGTANGYEKDKDKVFEKIAKAKPDIVLVALGIPLQEKLIYKHLNKFDKGIFVGVGGSFDVISGHKKRAPKLFIKLNLEWLYRILKEPYRVKRAIFLAAGFGSRLVPITLNTPKPLVLVNGKKIIETLLDAVVKAEIPEIIIVTGYLNEQFEILLKKYPNIKFIYNKKYNEANNISSAYLVRDKFSNSYVLESDLYLYNQDLIRKYEYHSNFLGFKVDRTDDWCLEIKNGIITKEKVGGLDCYQMCGISYYDKEIGKQMEKDIKEVFMSPGGKERYWEQVMLDIRKNNYKIYLRECKKEDIIEIDTFNELKAIDKTYDV